VILLVVVWRQKDVFPMVLSCLVDISTTGRWVSHGELVDYMARSCIQQIRAVCSGNPTTASISNMVAWFSQKVTAYQKGDLSERYVAIGVIQEASARFDRRKQRDSYSYRLKSLSEIETRTLGRFL